MGACGSDCGDFIAFFFADEQTGMDTTVELALPIATTSQTVSASQLPQPKAYQIVTETYNGVLGSMLQDGATDEYVYSRANEDLNQIRVTAPEPGAALLQAAALLCVVGLARRGRRARRIASTR